MSTLKANRIENLTTTDGGISINNSGNVGLGTSSPDSELHISKADTSTKLILERTSSATAKWSLAAGANSLLFKDEAANFERLRIDSSGRVLVGTSSARTFVGSALNSQFQIEGTNDDSSIVSITRNSNNTGSGRLIFAKSRGTTDGAVTVAQSGDNLGSILFEGADGNDTATAGAIDCAVDGAPGSNDMPGRLTFSTTADGASSPTERMRITKTGWKQSVAVDHVQTNSSAVGAGATYFFFAGKHSATLGSADSGTTSVAIYTNGNIQNTNNSYSQLSDVKLKENIVDANSQWDDLKAIQIRNWNFKAETGYETHTQIGVVAQEIETVSPGLVYETPDVNDEGEDLGTVTKSVNYSVLHVKALKALQEAMERIEALEAKVAAFEAG